MSAMTPADSCMKKQIEEYLALNFQPLWINYTKETPKTIKPNLEFSKKHDHIQIKYKD